MLLPYQFKIFAGDEAAPAGLSDDKAIALQLFVGPLCRDDADAQLLRQEADGRKGVPLRQFAGDDLALDLRDYLLVDGRPAALLMIISMPITLYSVYIHYTQ